ncbi:MAG TPA: hypothetical protein VIW24_05720 [Aldersonia sp.]
MTGLRVVLDAPARVPLDEVLVAIARVLNDGPEAVTSSNRVNLLEGDLDVVVNGPTGRTARAGWPWPIDSGLRQVELGPGEAVEGGVVLLVTDGLEPLFPVAGSYTLEARFHPTVRGVLQSPAVTVLREEPADAAGQRALEDPDAVQSLLSASQVGAAADNLAVLAGGDAPVARQLALLARGDAARVSEVSSASAGREGALTAAAAITAVLPPGLFPGDERLNNAVAALAGHDDPRIRALLTAEPWSVPGS